MLFTILLGSISNTTPLIMSTAHKPTWNPAVGRSSTSGSISSDGYLVGGRMDAMGRERGR